MDFGQVLYALKAGKKLAREGWNSGKGMWIVIQRGYPEGISINKNTADATGLPLGSNQKFLPYFMLKTADGAFVPWTPSQVDLLEEDWVFVD